jgi:hypothetical protein
MPARASNGRVSSRILPLARAIVNAEDITN